MAWHGTRCWALGTGHQETANEPMTSHQRACQRVSIFAPGPRDPSESAYLAYDIWRRHGRNMPLEPPCARGVPAAFAGDNIRNHNAGGYSRSTSPRWFLAGVVCRDVNRVYPQEKGRLCAWLRVGLLTSRLWVPVRCGGRNMCFSASAFQMAHRRN
jgi:hypothetical protein